MSLRKNNLIIGVAILLAFIGVGVFGLFPMGHAVHAVEAPMINCPYSANGYSICENTLAHISNWLQFSNAIFPSLIILLLVLGAIWIVSLKNFFNQDKNFYRQRHYLDNKEFYSPQTKLISWLSLFENSPSFAT